MGAPEIWYPFRQRAIRAFAVKYLFDAFLSHSSKDHDIADRLFAALSARGFQVWYDRKQVAAGDRIVKSVGEGLAQSRYLLVCHTRHSSRSHWVANEREIITTDEIASGIVRVVVLVFDATPVPAVLRHKRYVDLRSRKREKWDELFELLDADCARMIGEFRKVLKSGRRCAAAAGRLKDIAVRRQDSRALLALWECVLAKPASYEIVDASAYAIGQIAIQCRARDLQTEIADLFGQAVASGSDLIVDKFAYTAGQIAIHAVDKRRRDWAWALIAAHKNHADRGVKERFDFTARRIAQLQHR
jgi:hypothetical protein